MDKPNSKNNNKGEKVKQTLHLKFKKYIYKLMDFIHCLISVTIVIAIALTLVSLPSQLSMCLDIGSQSLIHFLEYVINVIIAVELIHVLLHQSLDTIVEILSLAITRELILERMHTYEILIGIAAIALLFVIRKYLFISAMDLESEENESAYDLNKPDQDHPRTDPDHRTWAG